VNKRRRQRMTDKPPKFVWLDRPCSIVEGSQVLVVGVDVRENKGSELLAYWRRESERRGIDTTESRAA
jgi:hypothetical protein